ncbi:MAG TPA: RNA polymerase sigma factor SigJ, partial [Micromonosporaceae bacterium]|nr:RNA polymerase sigma factor SigJ [Micromonosporaceae bacterium]
MDGVDGFEAHRSHLLAVAYRMLGSRADAEDAVQEAWLRYAGTDPATIRDLRGWLTTTTARICLDVLRSARVRREAYVGPWLPEPLVNRLPGPGGLASFAPDPADRAARTDEVSYALLVVMERLAPEQRVAFVLHDVFAVPFEQIAAVLGTSAAAARQLASRARRAVTADGVPRHRADRAEQRRVVAAFIAAAESGDLNGLVEVLAPDVIAIGDGGGVAPAGRHPVYGGVQVARFMVGLFRRGTAEATTLVIEPVLLNGDLGLLGEMTWPDGERNRVAMSFAIAGGRITGIFNQLNPAKLGAVPAP